MGCRLVSKRRENIDHHLDKLQCCSGWTVLSSPLLDQPEERATKLPAKHRTNVSQNANPLLEERHSFGGVLRGCEDLPEVFVGAAVRIGVEGRISEGYATFES